MEKIKTDFIGQVKNLALFVCVSAFAIVLAKYSQFLILPIYLYIVTAIYVFYYFKKGQDRASHIYFFLGFMVIVILSYSIIYTNFGIVDTGTDSEFGINKWDYYYFSIVTWTTLGYGDFKPTPESRMYAASQALLGYIYMALFVSKLFDWMNSIRSKKLLD